ncbi:DUF881 domain-containing protein [Intrasporangium chromatireducens]|nr:DUF881 domain-containing protein [Intrasporangium chromatireducens]
MPDDVEPARDPAAPAPRRRLRTWTVLVPVITAVAGLMFAMSFRAAQGSDLRADRDLPQLILDANERVEAQAARLDTLQHEVDGLSKAQAPRDARLGALTDKADAYAREVGRTPVSGPALTVTLTDSKVSLDSLPAQFTGDDIVVHQQDVQAVVNALWAGGAQAMMIQDQRVIATSAVRCVGNTLILQGRVYSPPYVITAIGDTGRMQRAVTADPTIQIYQQYVAAMGLGWDMSVERQAKFPAYSGSVELSHAQVIP